MKSQGYQHIRRLIALILVLAAAVFSSSAQEDAGKVRVGWFESPFFHQDANGNRSGYAHDLLIDIAGITGWSYEYVEGTWSELLDRLERGEIDILASVSHAPGRDSRILFSRYLMSREEYLLVAGGGSAINTGDVSKALAGKSVGVRKSTVQRRLLDTWLRDNRVSCTVKDLDYTYDDILPALEGNCVDFLVVPNTAERGDFMPLFRIGQAESYFGINHGKPEIKKELDRAMSQIFDMHPTLVYQLRDKYFSTTLQNHVLPEKERQWLADHGKIRIGYRDNYLPFCRQNPETGLTEGLLRDFIDHVHGCFANTDFEMEAVAYPSINDALAALKRGEVDAAFPFGESLADADDDKLVKTDAIVNSLEMAVIRTGDVFNAADTLRAAINGRNPNYISLLKDKYPHWKIVDYPSTVDCIRGIGRGEADLLLLSSYRVGVVAQYVRDNQLKAVPTGNAIAYGFATRKGETAMHSILCRLTGLMDSESVQTSLVSYSDVKVKTTVADFIKDNLLKVLIFVIALIAVLLTLYLRTRSAHRKLDERLFVIDSTRKRYFCAYLIDVRKNHFKEEFALPNMTALLGRSGEASTILTAAWKFLVVDEDKPAMKEFHDMGKWNDYLRDKDVHSCEYRGVTSGWSRANIFAAKRDSNGDVEQVVYTLERIHEQKEAEQKLAEHLEEITALNSQMASVNETLTESLRVISSLKNIYDALYYIDLTTGHFTELNPTSIERVRNNIGSSGDAREKFLQMSRHLVMPEYAEAVLEFTNLDSLADRLSDRETISATFRGLDYFWLSGMFVVANRDAQGRCTHVLWSVENITSQWEEEIRKQQIIESNIASNKAKTRFLQNMSHEIRTPLNALFGFAQLMGLPDGSWTDEEKATFNGYIMNSYSMLDMLIGDIIDTADFESGNYRVEMSDVTVNAVCRNALASVEYRKPADVELLFTTDLADDRTVHSDGRRIQQVLVNFLTNACKHTTQGRIELHCSDSEHPGKICFSVTDTGTGVPEDKVDLIFGRFTKLDKNTQGSGLGLNICKVVADKLGAQVYLDREYTGGARFVFELDAQ